MANDVTTTHDDQWPLDAQAGGAAARAAFDPALSASIVAHAPYAMVACDEHGRIVVVNRRLEQLFGYGPHELVGQDIEVLLPDSARQRHRVERETYTAAPAPLEMAARRELAGRHRSGREFPVEVGIEPIDTPAGRLFVAAVTDVTRSRATEHALAESETRFQELAQRMSDVFWTIEWPSRRVLHANPAFELIWGWSLEALAENPHVWLEGVHPADRQLLESALGIVEAGGTFECEYRVVSRLGGIRVVRHRGFPVRDPQGGVCRVASVAEDVTERRRAEDLLFREKERAQITLSSIGDGVVTTDAAGCVDGLNPVAERLLGWTVHEARGRHVDDVVRVIDETTRQPGENPVARCLRLGRVCGAEFPALLVRRDGSTLNIDDSAAPMLDPSGRLLGAVMVFRDVTTERQLAREVTYHATHDELTGLLNRREFERRLGLMLAHTREQGRPMAVCYVDLDQFKIVNDTCGHVAGDELLRQFATLVRTRVRERDTLARLGGDEFGILLGECSLDQAMRIALELRDLIVDFRFAWEEHTFRIGASIGVVPVVGPGELASVLGAADAACYMAKERGGNRVEIVHPDGSGGAQRQSEITLLTRIQRALAGDGLRLYSQRIVPLQPGDPAPVHVELLLRVANEGGGVLPPAAFISAAERYHQMRTIDRWVVRQALQGLRDHPGDDSLCAVNLSGQSLGDDEFLTFVETELDATGVDPARLCFEITETAAIANFGAAVRFINALRKRGCRFALDDFGIGLSSFAYLKALPVDYIKIDGTFVRDMANEPVDCAMVEAIQRVARVMGIKTVAESVENEAVMVKLRTIGVDFAQGYAVARPGPASFD